MIDILTPLSLSYYASADFDHGTKVISDPGVYKLCENISFGPNGPASGQLPDENAFDPVFDGGWSPNEFSLGFFAALCVASPDVTIHLNDFAIEQSPGHALMQRFFAVIELASSPFISGAGPANFVGEGEAFVPARNVSILGPGSIGRSSHHGRSFSSLLVSSCYYSPDNLLLMMDGWHFSLLILFTHQTSSPSKNM
jgi:hypothetical protein